MRWSAYAKFSVALCCSCSFIFSCRNKRDSKNLFYFYISGSREELGDVEYCNGERKQNSSSGGKGKVRGVPPSFGYVKRPINGTGKGETRTAQVSAVPRTKVFQIIVLI